MALTTVLQHPVNRSLATSDGPLRMQIDMSMPNWLNDAPIFQPNENGAFNPGSGDPSMGFMQTPTTASFEFSQMQSQLLQQRMQNGNARNGSPAYHNPMYQTQSVVPSKRPRPREHSIGASPQQNPAALPASGSQTPQGSYPGFQGAVNGSQQFTGTPTYPQYQQAGNNRSHSPIMQGQPYNPQASQRVQTMSPSPFSPAAQTFGAQTSPPQSEHGSRVNTPQNSVQQYAQATPYSSAPGQPFTPPGSTVNGAALAQYNQHLQNQQHQQRINEARMRQMQQQRQQAGAFNSVTQLPNQMSAHQIAALRAHQAQQRPNNPEQLLRTITQWTQQHGQPFNPQPVIAGRHMSAVTLFMLVVKMGGSKRVSALQQWPNVAASLGLPSPQAMIAAQDLQNYWHLNLSAYEQWFQSQQQHRRQMVDPMRVSGPQQGGDAAARQGAFSPTKQTHNQQIQQPMQPPNNMYPQYQTPTKHMTPPQHDPRQPLQNGYIAQQSQGRPSNMYSLPQPSMQAPPRAAPSQALQKPPEPQKQAERKKTDPWPRLAELGEVFGAQVKAQGGETLRSYGGLNVHPTSNFLGTVESLLKYKSSVPKLVELGVVDIRALILSLRSGIHAEVRLALDTLATLSAETTPIVLGECDDLLETLIDCADDQVQLLAEHSAEVSDAMLINSYEETIRGCKVENTALQDIPAFGTLEYDLDRAADRLICITTILRNFSFLSSNHLPLVDPVVINLLSTVIRYVGTRSMVLRTHQNLLDFSKDIITFLTNVSQEIDLPGKEEALCILHFLLSFAPSPAPNTAEEGEIVFSPYVPVIHRYYPHAVDSLAKLLARGDPNRSYYRSIFASDAASSPPYDLLTRAFGLAIAATPLIAADHLFSLLKIRAPYLIQGLLAGEILASLIPASEHELARSWLASQDGFAMSLLRIATELGKQPPNLQQRDPRNGKLMDPDPHGTATICERGFALLRKLLEKAKDVDGNGLRLPPGVLPDRRMVVQAAAQGNLPRGDYYVIRQLCALSSLDS